MMSYTASNQKLVEAGRDQAIKAGNSLEGQLSATVSQNSLPDHAAETLGAKGRTSMSMDKNPDTTFKSKWNISNISNLTRNVENMSGGIMANRSLVSKI